MLFCAAQAPELFGRDQRYAVLPLYFSRALTRSDYAWPSSAAWCSRSSSCVAPQVVLFAGASSSRADPVTGHRPTRSPRCRVSCSRAALVAGPARRVWPG